MSIESGRLWTFGKGGRLSSKPSGAINWAHPPVLPDPRPRTKGGLYARLKN